MQPTARSEAAPTAPGVTPTPPLDPERPLGWRGWLPLAVCVAIANGPLLHLVVRGDAPVVVTGPRYEDRFDRAALGDAWFTTGGQWRIESGTLHAPGPRNNPLWLRMRLPDDFAIEFTARSETRTGPRTGDVKFELCGDGRSHASGYVLVFGGWGNAVTAIARLDEHGKDRVERHDRKVEPGRTYRIRVERRGRALRWLVDGELLLAYDDPRPLRGPGHDRFGFSGWDADVFFDELVVTPL